MEHKRSFENDQHMLDRDLLPCWGQRKAASIERRDVIALLDSIMERGAPVAANRTKSLISKIFNFGISRAIVETNPAHLIPKPGDEQSRTRVLSESEIRSLWTALDAEPTDLRDAVRLLLLTGQRKTEVTGMEWAEIDGEQWIIPGRRTKNKLEHAVPLGPQAMAILRDRRTAAKGSVYVFPVDRRATGHVDIDKVMDRLRTRLGFVPSWTTHDLRRTASSGMTAIGITRFIADKVLNHSDRSVGAIYDRNAYLKEKRSALERWDRRLAAIVNGKAPEKVVSLRG